MAPLGASSDNDEEVILGTSEMDYGEHRGTWKAPWQTQMLEAKQSWEHQGNLGEGSQTNSWLCSLEKGSTCSQSA